MNEQYVPLSTDIANKISEMILLEKRFPPGSKIPNEIDFANELGVSRTSIREAVKTLIANNILVIKRGKGTFVTSNPGLSSDPFGLSLLADKKKLVSNWFEMRLFLEPASVRLAAQRATAAELEEIAMYERQEADMIAKGLDYSLADQQFHASIAKATHNEVIERLIPSLQFSVAEALATARYGKSIDRSIENALTYHKEIVRFLMLRDAEGASIAMMYHIKRGLSDLGY